MYSSSALDKAPAFYRCDTSSIPSGCTHGISTGNPVSSHINDPLHSRQHPRQHDCYNLSINRCKINKVKVKLFFSQCLNSILH